MKRKAGAIVFCLLFLAVLTAFFQAEIRSGEDAQIQEAAGENITKENVEKQNTTKANETTEENGTTETTETTDLSANSTLVQSDFVAALGISEETDSILVVIGDGGSRATLSFHTRDSQGIWVQQFETDADVGKNGITGNKEEKREGDGYTPSGCYEFLTAFGIAKDPGSLLAYQKVTEKSYWVDDVDSPYYNQWVDAGTTPGSFESEHLIDHDPSYQYALALDYNKECIPGKGSAIFLHCKSGKGKTTGCVAVDKAVMMSILQQVDENTRIVIVQNPEELKEYEKARNIN